MPRNFAPSPRTLHRTASARNGFGLFFVGLAGGVWGLGLARALAESYPNSPTFELGPTLLLTLVAASTALGIRWGLVRWMGSSGGERAGLDLAFFPLFLAVLYLMLPGVAPRVGWALLGGSLVLVGLFIARQAMDVSTRSSPVSYAHLVALLLGCITLALYLRTLGPTVGQADTFEFQVVAPTLGVAHPTGYPLYILSGKLFSFLPFGSVAWRVNLTSTVFAVTAVLCLFVVIYRLTNRPLVAFLASLAFAFSRVFWSQAVVAEVYALHNVLVAVVLLILLEGVGGGWWALHSREEEANGRYRIVRAFNPLYALALVLGLSFANHLTTALLLPAIALFFLFMRPKACRRNWLIAAGLFFLGLALYLYIYFRWPALHDGIWMSPGEFWRYITAQQFGGALRLDAWRTDPTRYEIVGRLLREPFGWPGLVFGAVGLVWLAVKNRLAAIITLGTFLAFAWYALSYYVRDVAVFLLPAHLVLAIWLGLGMLAILTVLDMLLRRAFGFRRAPTVRDRTSVNTVRRWGALILLSMFALIPLWLLWTNFSLVDQSDEQDAYAWGDSVLDLSLAKNAAVLADSVRIAPLYYLQRIEGRRPDLDLLVLADEKTYRAELETRLADGQAVYLARFLPGLEGRYHLRSLGPLTEVATNPMVDPPVLDRTLGVRFGAAAGKASVSEDGSVELLGITGPGMGTEGGAGLTLFWRTDEQIGKVYHVRLRLVDDAGQVWWQEDGRHAANNVYPTPAWRPGEVVADYHEIPPGVVGPVASPDGYTIQVGLFRPFSDDGMPAENGENWVPVADLMPAPSGQSTPDHLLRARFSDTSEESWRWRNGDGGLTLVGVDLPNVVAANSLVELRLYPAAPGTEPTSRRSDSTLFQAQPVLWWTDHQGDRIEASIVDSWGWSRLLLQAPPSSGDYELRLGFVDQNGDSLPARCGWLARPADGCVVAGIRITEMASSALANFDGKMLLLDTDLPELADGSPSPLSAGQKLPLTLHWQALQWMEDDYTVSVQLVGPDGRLYGQTDTWPVQGTLPTSEWVPDQRVVDPYQVTLDAGAPPGDYQVGIVVYLLGTQARLPVVDALGAAKGDIVWLGELRVIP
jgi:hypothetical protein